MTQDILEVQLLDDENFKKLTGRDKLICSLYHIDGVVIKDMSNIKKRDITKGVYTSEKNFCTFCNLTQQLAKEREFDLLCVDSKEKKLSIRTIQLIQAKVVFTDLPIVGKIVDSMDTLFDENLSLDEALDKCGLDLSGWKYPISKDSAMSKPYYNKATGFSKTKKGFVYILRYVIEGKEFLKFGITSNIKKRTNHSKRMNNSEMDVLYFKEYRTGSEALDIENKIKRSVPCGLVGKDILPDGYTETCDIKYLNKLKSIIAP